MKILSFDLAYMDSTQDFLTYLQEVCEVFQLQIVGLIPVGPAGGWPEVTFKGEEENLRRFTDLFFDGQEPDYFDDNSDDDDSELYVFSDPRFTTKGNREFINDDGTFID
jgi:hypothetical protein